MVLLTRSLVVLKTTGYHPKVCCPLSCNPQTNYRPKVCCPLSCKAKAQCSSSVVCCPLSCTPQTNYRPKVRCLLSVVRRPFRTNQSSRGYQRGRANAKTSVLPATYGNLCTSVWFCKDTKTEIATLTVCPVLSCFVLFCPVLSRFVPFLGTTNRPPPTCGLVVSLS